MRGVLIGADLMYRQDGRLVPIEINTNVGWDSANRKETEKEALDPSDIIMYTVCCNILHSYICKCG